MIEHRRFSHWNPQTGALYDVIQTWALIPGTGVWAIIAVQPVTTGPDQESRGAE